MDRILRPLRVARASPFVTSGRWRLPILALVALVLGHDLTFLAANGLDGLGVALSESGHDAYWPFTWVVALGGVVALAIVGALRAAALLGRLRAGDATAAPLGGTAAYGAEVWRLWPRIAVIALTVFVGQEAVEHAALHGGHLLAPLDFVRGDYAATLPAFATAALLVAAVAALFVRAIAVLEEAVRRAAAPRRRPAQVTLRPATLYLVRLDASLATPDMGRAPPLLIGS